MLTKSLEGLEEQALAGSPEKVPFAHQESCLLYTSDAADDANVV